MAARACAGLILALSAATLAGCLGRGGTDVLDVRVGMTRGDVRDVAGAPDRTGVAGACWVYYLPSGNDPYAGGRSVCFRNGRVARIYRVVHG